MYFTCHQGERNKKPYKPWVITEGRKITDKEHQPLYKEKEIKYRKEKEKEDRKKA